MKLNSTDASACSGNPSLPLLFVRLTATLALVLTTSCAYSASVLTTRAPASQVNAERAIRIAEQTARRFRMKSLGGFDGDLPSGARLIAEFAQGLYSLEEYYPIDGSLARIQFGVYLESDGALRFALLDYSHGRETDYVRLIRGDLEERLLEAFPQVELQHRQHSGRTLPP